MKYVTHFLDEEMDKKKGSNKQDIPDSTTKFFEGEEVFVQSNDQFILGKIKEIDEGAEKCLVNIDSGETVWAPFKDLKTWTIDIDESPVKCNLCQGTQSRKNNVVVTCEVCFRGYHQKCYQPIIESADTNWMCKKCRKKQNCQSLENTATQKTVSSTSKDHSLPRNFNDVTYNEKKRHGRNHVSIHNDVNAFKGQKVCIKSATPPFYADEQRKTTSKVKKKSLPAETKSTTTANTVSDTPLPPELPPTPPSSISAPETPQPLPLNGEAPVSPTEEMACVDFGDISPPATELATCRLEELLAASRESPSDITLPLQLNHVIVDPLIRPTKRHLSEKDIKIVNGVVKKRRRFRRLSNVGIRPIDPALPSTSRLSRGGVAGLVGGLLAASPLKATLPPPSTVPVPVPNGRTAADLKTLVYRYLNDECKQMAESERLHRFSSGEEYRVCGKRQTVDGRVEYLIEWIKCTDPL